MLAAPAWACHQACTPWKRLQNICRRLAPADCLPEQSCWDGATQTLLGMPGRLLPEPSIWVIANAYCTVTACQFQIITYAAWLGGCLLLAPPGSEYTAKAGRRMLPMRYRLAALPAALLHVRITTQLRSPARRPGALQGLISRNLQCALR
jgi:hypothetical protein